MFRKPTHILHDQLPCATRKHMRQYLAVLSLNRRHRRAILKCPIMVHQNHNFLRITARENYYYLAHQRRAQQPADDSTKTRHTPARTLTRPVHDADA